MLDAGFRISSLEFLIYLSRLAGGIGSCLLVLGSWNFIQLSSDCSNYKVLAAAWAHGCRALYITADEYVQVVLLKFPGQVAGN
jgi:hypothetical protein